ncbi:MarR family winged helix-turn-helix transcriptional regulator [Demequina sp. NBRC 110057]|uniref:MarR family winged helix-turn-helix transcriptional regulator n=1 Tax=Demequina sp. NBRC 110057 TaxID=1570346 RepID=UPI0009FEBCE0|nr:MarR family transcriptional regulator [Demequina sp. NBRC 110057]
MDAELTGEERAAYTAVVKSAALLRRAVEHSLTDHGDISRVQFEILNQLHGAPEGLRMHALADRIVHSRSGLTYQVAQLEKAGLVTRESSAGNERAIVARCTPAGRALRDAVYTEHFSRVREHFFGVLEPGELEAITTALTKVIDSLERETGALDA